MPQYFVLRLKVGLNFGRNMLKVVQNSGQGVGVEVVCASNVDARLVELFVGTSRIRSPVTKSASSRQMFFQSSKNAVQRAHCRMRKSRVLTST